MRTFWRDYRRMATHFAPHHRDLDRYAYRAADFKWLLFLPLGKPSQAP